jgi:hypothetical protein
MTQIVMFSMNKETREIVCFNAPRAAIALMVVQAIKERCEEFFIPFDFIGVEQAFEQPYAEMNYGTQL